jgi:membrane protein
MAKSFFGIVAASVKRFNDDKCWTSAIVISYFTFLSGVPLIALFAFVTAKTLGSSELAFRSLNVFTDRFLTELSPHFMEKIKGMSDHAVHLGLFGIIGSLIAASFLFSNLIAAINHIFKTKNPKSFFYNRLMEYLIMFVIGILMFFSLSITVVWTAIQRGLRETALASGWIQPKFLALVNNVFVQYLIPYALTFLVFFVLFKFIPEVKVHTRNAAVAAAVSGLLLEVFKRLFAFYLAHLSAIGIVLSKFSAGTLTSIIFFLLWISLSYTIMLWGAELTAVLNERRLTHAD